MTKKLLIASRVEQIEELSPRIRRFTVRAVNRPSYPEAVPGSHVLVRHRTGVLRSYSLCDGEPGATYQFAVLREDEGRGGSLTFHRDTQVGDPLHVSYPSPSLTLADSAREHVFVAGGIGITPFVPLAWAAHRRGEPATLHYAVRSRSDAAFLSTLEAIPQLTVHLYASDEGRRLDVPALIGRLPSDAHLYVCGPQRLLDAVNSAADGGPASDRVHLESFTGLDPAAAQAGEPFSVELTLSRRVVDVSGTQSLLQALTEAGLAVDSSCEGGVCGACRVTLLGGQAIHRDICLTPREREQNIITCVSRGDGRLSLHL